LINSRDVPSPQSVTQRLLQNKANSAQIDDSFELITLIGCSALENAHPITTLRMSRRTDVARLGAAAFTKTALDGGRTMGLTTAEMLAVIASLSRREFYKSMTTYADHRVWQDVYHAATPMRKDSYIKITLRDAAPVIQFKEK
jgi:hypothetical protein